MHECQRYVCGLHARMYTQINFTIEQTSVGLTHACLNILLLPFF